jgi:RES domain-containing protein
MNVYRLTKKRFVNDLSGTGARIAGGRWNKPGNGLLYTSDSRALCTAEIAVHIPMGVIPTDYYLIHLEIPDSIMIYELNLTRLPKEWDKFPYCKKTQEIGQEFIESKEFLVMKVPSAVVKGDYNYLINPDHDDFDKIHVVSKTKFTFDKRLFKS